MWSACHEKSYLTNLEIRNLKSEISCLCSVWLSQFCLFWKKIGKGFVNIPKFVNSTNNKYLFLWHANHIINKNFKNASNFVRQYTIIFTWFNATLRNRSWIWFMALSTDEIAFAIGSNSALSLVDITWMNAGTFGPDILPYFGYQIRTFETVTLFCWDLSNWFCQRFDRGLFRGCSRLIGLKSTFQLRIDSITSGLTCSTIVSVRLWKFKDGVSYMQDFCNVVTRFQGFHLIFWNGGAWGLRS